MHGKKAFCFILILANVLFLALLLGFKITFSENLGLSKTKFSQNDVNFTQNAEFLNQNTTNLSQNTENLAKNGKNLSKNATNLSKNGDNLAQNTTNLSQNATNFIQNGKILNQNATNLSKNAENLAQNTEISAFTAQILSFEFAFFATLLIILISFFSYKKSILKFAQSAENAEIFGNQNADFINKNAVNLSTNLQNEQNAKFINQNAANLSIQQNENSQIQVNLQNAKNTEFPNQNTQILAVKNDDFLNKNGENLSNQTAEFSNQNAQISSDQKAQNDDLNSSESDQESGVKPKFNFKYLGLFFSLAKILGYAFLAAGFLALNRHTMLDLVGFLGGISSLIFAVLIFAFYLRKK